MAVKRSFVDKKTLDKLNERIFERARVDREDILEFLKMVDTSDGKIIVTEVQKWLEDLHADPKFTKVIFQPGDIEAILSDLDTYGRVQAETIMQYKQSSNKTLPIS